MKHSLALVGLIASLVFVIPDLAVAQETQAAPSAAAVDTRLALRDLWVEHIFWTRNYVLANAEGQADLAKVAADEVVANATAIAGSIAPLYGQAAADTLLGLLAGHWTAIKHYSDATVAHDDKGLDTAVADMNSNAGEIADFLSQANPYLPRDTVLSLLSAHASHHVSQVQQIDRGEYAQEAKTWHAMRAHILTVSDALASALVQQFPDKF